MKEAILITGAGPNGVTGRRIKDAFATNGEYALLTPSSTELDLTDTDAVDRYFLANQIDYVIHSAVVYPQKDNHEDFYLNLKMFYNLASHSGEFRKMFYFGSGAEYDKRREITNISEETIGERVPSDSYGLSKYIMNQALTSPDCNIFNIRLFGTINPNERFTKNVISNLCMKAVKGMPLELRQNCRFSFTDIDDVIAFLKYGIEHDLEYNDYNFVPNESCLLSQIGGIIGEIEGNNYQISFQNKGLNKEYTASNKRVKLEFDSFTPLAESVRKVYLRMKEAPPDLDIGGIDGRWK